MTLSIKRLAGLLDAWCQDNRIIITETEAEVVIGKLQAADALTLTAELDAGGWPFKIEDGTASIVERDAVEPDFEPYRIVASKPPPATGRSRVLTNAGLADWLTRAPSAAIVEVGRLEGEFQTYGVMFTSWGSTSDFSPEPLSADPRKVVKDHNASRTVEPNLSRFILRADQKINFDNAAEACFAEISAKCLVVSLCNELEVPQTLAYRGPPVARFELVGQLIPAIGENAFDHLHECARWVFALPKEMETRHILLTAELSRSTPGSADIINLLKSALGPALEGAKIAYEMGLHKISADSLKALADLRKAISDEASKLSDSTRQLAGSVSSALFGGIGLIAVRMTMAVASPAVAGATLLIGIVLCVYVGVIIASGWQFVTIQRELRQAWRNRLYRFLPETEYKRMVVDPARKAEQAFETASIVSAILAALLLVAVMVVSVPEIVDSLHSWYASLFVRTKILNP
ncbi:hypothetical protein [Shinella sumterensis]|uniref:hypothetical protein n=1 Tax=Shinella sumterensis TaxID=1967501 RepID=UPI003F8773F7